MCGVAEANGDAGIRLTTYVGLHTGLSAIEELLSTLIGTVGGVSLVVSGVGVMSVMLEAAVVMCAGGLLGIVAGPALEAARLPVAFLAAVRCGDAASRHSWWWGGSCAENFLQK